MLILTTDILNAYFPFPEWPGPRVVIDTEAAPQDNSEKNPPIRIEYLQKPQNAVQVFCDISQWLGQYFEHNSEPFLYMDRKTDVSEIRTLADLGHKEPQIVQATFDDDDRLVSLCLGKGIGQSPLLLEFLTFIRKRDKIDDRTLVNLLNEAFIRNLS